MQILKNFPHNAHHLLPCDVPRTFGLGEGRQAWFRIQYGKYTSFYDVDPCLHTWTRSLSLVFREYWEALHPDTPPTLWALGTFYCLSLDFCQSWCSPHARCKQEIKLNLLPLWQQMFDFLVKDLSHSVPTPFSTAFLRVHVSDFL